MFRILDPPVSSAHNDKNYRLNCHVLIINCPVYPALRTGSYHLKQCAAVSTQLVEIILPPQTR